MERQASLCHDGCDLLMHRPRTEARNWAKLLKVRNIIASHAVKSARGLSVGKVKLACATATPFTEIWHQQRLMLGHEDPFGPHSALCAIIFAGCSRVVGSKVP